MNNILRLAVLALAFIVTIPAFADGEVFYQGNHSFGASVFAPGNANFYFGGQNGPAIFQGTAFTGNGMSQIWGQVGFSANSFVPDGTKGTAQAGGNFSYQFGAGHQGGFPYSSYSTNINNWSSSTGSGSANSNIYLDGNMRFSPIVPTTSPVPGKG
jgi:hypothetical protein